MTIHILIPGEPCAQGRPRMAVVNGHARAFDPAKSRSWKGAARDAMAISMVRAERQPILDGPIEVRLLERIGCNATGRPKGTKARREAKEMTMPGISDAQVREMLARMRGGAVTVEAQSK